MPGGIGRRRPDNAGTALDDDAAVAAGLTDPGVVRNTLLQLASQVAGAVFTGGLTLYLVRALGASGYGVYALAFSIASLVLYPAGLGLPWSIGRFLADHLDDVAQLRAILRLGLRLQTASAVVLSAALFVAAGPLADAFGDPRLGWPLRWMAVGLLGQALFAFVTSAVTSIRRVSIGLWMAIVESTIELVCSAGLVLAGAGAAGAALGKTVGYLVAATVGTYLIVRLIGGLGTGATTRVSVGFKAIARYSGAMLVVDVTWSAISQIDLLLVGALLSSAAVGSLGAVLRILILLGYLGLAVSSGVAPRLSLRSGRPDTRAFEQAIRYLVVVQGVVIAPLVIWAGPIVSVLFGPGYHSAPALLRVLTVQAFVAAPASLISVAVTYLGEARRRLRIVLGTFVLGMIATYFLIRAVGVVGAAIGDDLVQVVYVGAHLWICARLIDIDLRRIAVSVARTLLAAALMALLLFAVGTEHLAVWQWIVGLLFGTLLYAGALLGTREVTVAEIASVTARVRRGSSR